MLRKSVVCHVSDHMTRTRCVKNNQNGAFFLNTSSPLRSKYTHNYACYPVFPLRVACILWLLVQNVSVMSDILLVPTKTHVVHVRNPTIIPLFPSPMGHGVELHIVIVISNMCLITPTLFSYGILIKALSGYTGVSE